MPTLVTKDCKFLHARTRRYFKKIEEDTHTTFFVDGKIAGRISDEGSDDGEAYLYRNIHDDGDEEDLDEDEASSAVDAYTKKLTVPPPNYVFPETAAATDEVDAEVDDTHDPWPENLKNGTWCENNRFYSSLDDESFYKIAKKNGMDPTRLLQSHKEFYPKYLRLHSKLQGGTLIDRRLYDMYSATNRTIQTVQDSGTSSLANTPDNGDKKTSSQAKKVAGSKRANNSDLRKKRKGTSQADDNASKRRLSSMRSGRIEKGKKVSYTEWDSNDDNSSDDSESSGESEEEESEYSGNSTDGESSSTGGETIEEDTRKSTRVTRRTNRARKSKQAKKSSAASNSAENSSSDEDVNSDALKNVENYVQIHVEAVLAVETRSIADWEKKCERMNTTHLYRGSIFAQKRRNFREGELERETEKRYLIKWKNYSHLHVSWETIEDIHSMCDQTSAKKLDKFIDSSSLRKSEQIFKFPVAERIFGIDKREKWFDIDNPPCEICQECEHDEDNPALLCDGCAFGSAHLKCLKLTAVPEGEWLCQVCAKKKDLVDNNLPIPLTLQYDHKMVYVKWEGMNYSSSTWEHVADVADDNLLEEFLRISKFPRSVPEPKRMDPQQYLKLVESTKYKNGNKLRSYQIESVKWMVWNFIHGRSSLLADEMGLGKTVQTVAFLNQLHDHHGAHGGPFLVVVPLSTIPHWIREFRAWTNMNAVVLHGDPESRDIIYKYEWRFLHPEKNYVKLGKSTDLKFDVLITTYEGISMSYERLKRVNWKVLVVDEAHRLKNRRSKLMENFMHFKFDKTLLLTGTPIQNSMKELWSLLNFIAPDAFGTEDSFNDKFGNMISSAQIDDLHSMIEKYFLRRLKGDVERIPPREETIIEVELTIEQKRYYRAIYEQNRKYLYRGLSNVSKPSLINISMELRKCCNHPFLINGAEQSMLAQAKNSITANDMLIQACGKCVLLDKLLPKLQADGHRVLIFSQMVRMLDILADYLSYRGYKYASVDGRQRGNERQQAIDKFTDDPSVFVMLLSTRAGGLGINLVSADTVIIYDSDWNPQNDVQAMARCHRIGQTKQVQVYRLLSTNTYEMEMFQAASKKLGLDQAVLNKLEEDGAQGVAIAKGNGNNPEGKSPSEEASNLERRRAKFGLNSSSSDSKRPSTLKENSKKDVEQLLRHGAYNMLREDDDERSKTFCEADIEDILKTSTRKIHAVSGSDQSASGKFGQAGSKFSRATFVADGAGAVDIDDPNFWKKIIGLEDEDQKAKDVILSGKRKRTKVKSYREEDNFADIDRAIKNSRNDTKESDFDLDEEDDDIDEREDEEEDLSIKSKWYSLVKDRLLAFGWGRWDEISKNLIASESSTTGRLSPNAHKPNVFDIQSAAITWIAIWAINAAASDGRPDESKLIKMGKQRRISDHPSSNAEKTGTSSGENGDEENMGETSVLSKLNAWLPGDALSALQSVPYVLGANQDRLRNVVQSKVAECNCSMRKIELDLKLVPGNLASWLGKRLSRFSTSKILPKLYNWLTSTQEDKLRWRVQAEIIRSKSNTKVVASSAGVKEEDLYFFLYRKKPKLEASKSWGLPTLKEAFHNYSRFETSNISRSFKINSRKILEDWQTILEKNADAESSLNPTIEYQIPIPDDFAKDISLDHNSPMQCRRFLQTINSFFKLQDVLKVKAQFEDMQKKYGSSTKAMDQAASLSIEYTKPHQENPHRNINFLIWVPDKPILKTKLPHPKWTQSCDAVLLIVVYSLGATNKTFKLLQKYYCTSSSWNKSVNDAAALEEYYSGIVKEVLDKNSIEKSNVDQDKDSEISPTSKESNISNTSLSELSQDNLAQNYNAIEVKWTLLKQRYSKLVAQGFLQIQKNMKRLNDRRKMDANRVDIKMKAFSKQICKFMRESNYAAAPWLCCSCGGSNRIQQTVCRACNEPRKAADTTISGVSLAKETISQKLLRSTPCKLFTIGLCPSTKIPMITSINSAACPLFLNCGDYIIKIKNENVVQKNIDVAGLYDILYTSNADVEIVTSRKLSLFQQSQIIRDASIKMLRKKISTARSNLKDSLTDVATLKMDLDKVEKSLKSIKAAIESGDFSRVIPITLSKKQKKKRGRKASVSALPPKKTSEFEHGTAKKMKINNNMH